MQKIHLCGGGFLYFCTNKRIYCTNKPEKQQVKQINNT